MPGFKFNTPEGQTVARELLIAYLNTGTTISPVWSPLGKRTDDSSMDYDWSEETSQDILGNTWATMKKPVVSQSFDPLPLDASDEAVKKIHQLAILEQNAQALTSQDMLIGHWYLDENDNEVGHFAERYNSCMVKPSSLGGEGGGNIGMPTDVTYGGERTVGTISKGTTGGITFVPESSSSSGGSGSVE